MRLTELDPQYHRYRKDETGTYLPRVDTLSEAQGVMFLCPSCFKKNGGPVGTHSVLIWFNGRGVPPEAEPTARWGVNGSGYGDLTITPSIDLTKNDPSEWHGFVTNGEVT